MCSTRNTLQHMSHTPHTLQHTSHNTHVQHTCHTAAHVTHTHTHCSTQHTCAAHVTHSHTHTQLPLSSHIIPVNQPSSLGYRYRLPLHLYPQDIMSWLVAFPPPTHTHTICPHNTCYLHSLLTHTHTHHSGPVCQWEYFIFNSGDKPKQTSYKNKLGVS